MKTNHRRGFRASTHTDKAMETFAGRSTFSNKSFGAYIGNDFVKGNRGMAKDVRGAKKFIRSRIRFHDKAATKQLAQQHEI
jgi:hypothetical protein